ncbi:dihydroxyacetone kinase, phosphotransfer subunit [Atopostipes suicloacalis DSM 15692]|uniref:phosphoenolpyruvate--glycerone phosphotransferase n=1 Tax=Atopostipes suicloacalis DSM 15692 TaxID=1121025 RepID=A0A1M4X708_9LACT|nr:dihydroxyacetone kinase phosphoryl donor subunit DhaM [Atopostipes suicloacalis]SHE89256.1 dihydroxyacetone kinase, phosphotransfer subunit [Atopostipes suicloacalis DSM 15692]
MTNKYGILLVSHVEEITDGLLKLLDQVAGDVSIKTAGGTENGEIGTNFEKINQVLNAFEEEKILAFYDLGSAKMNLEMAMEYSDKEITLYETAFIEGSYVAASLLQADVDIEVIEEQLKPLIVKE